MLKSIGFEYFPLSMIVASNSLHPFSQACLANDVSAAYGHHDSVDRATARNSFRRPERLIGAEEEESTKKSTKLARTETATVKKRYASYEAGLSSNAKDRGEAGTMDATTYRDPITMAAELSVKMKSTKRIDGVSERRGPWNRKSA